MRPISLKLQGFKGIRSRSGKDVIQIDFSGLSGLAAITGPNGAGKTTILDNLHPYRIMPYRSGGYSPRSFSFYPETYGRGATKDLVFEFGGKKYRSLLLIDAEKKKQEAYLFVEDDGEWNVIGDTNGKVENYDSSVNFLFGSPQLFFTSVFRCQDAPKLTDYTKGEIKDIFVELLGIESLKIRGSKAKEMKDNQLKELEFLKNDQRLLATDVDNAKTAKVESKRINLEIQQLAVKLGEVWTYIESCQSSLMSVKAEIAVQEALLKEKLSLESDAKAITGKLEKFRKNTSRAAEVRKSVDDVAKISLSIEKLRKEYADIEGVIANLQKIYSDFREVELSIAEKEKKLSKFEMARKNEFDNLKKDLEKSQKTKALLENVPCGADLHGRCLLLKEAVLAKYACVSLLPKIHSLKNATADEKSLSKEIEKLKSDLLTVENIRKSTETHNKEREEIRQKIQSFEKALSAASKEASFLPEVELAEKAIPELESDLKKVQEKLSGIANNGELALKEKELFRTLEELQKSSRGLSEKESELKRAIGAVEAQIARGSEAEKKLSSLNERTELVNRNISEWVILEKAFSNDGIIALEIDDAGPTISSIANDLLQSCFGSRFSVRIDTQVAKSDGKGLKETFDIIIYDTERDESKSLRSMSGGEKVWIEEAITRAISLYNSSRSGRKYQALFTDEKDGSLDHQKKKEFLAMKKKVLELGGYDLEIFISQSPEIQELADCTLSIDELSVGEAA